MESIKVLSYNVLQTLEKPGRREDFFTRMGETIVQEDPDVFGTQENTAKILNGMMADVPGYSLYKGEAYYDGNLLGNYVYWKTDKYTALETGHWFMSDTPDVKSKFEGSNFWRGFSYVFLESKKTGNRFLFIDVHTDYRAEEPVRVEQLKVLTKFLKEKNAKDLPVILVGDFNTTEKKESITTFLADNPRMGMTSKVAKTKGDTGATLAISEFTRRDAYTFDYIFVSTDRIDTKYYSVVDNMTDGKYPSDHLPIVAELDIY